MGPPKAEKNLPTYADSQLTCNTQDTSSKLMKNVSSGISKLEKIFSDEITTYTSVTSAFHSQNFLFYDKIRKLEPDGSISILWEFVFDSAKLCRLSSDPLVEPVTKTGSPIFRTHPPGSNFFIIFDPYGIGSATGKSA